MVAPVTPQEWLPVLAKRLDDRRPRVERLRSYANGNAPVPNGSKNLRAAWESFQRRARTNFGALIVESVAERIQCTGVTVGEASADDDRAREIWNRNRLDVVLGDAIRDALTAGIGYVAVGQMDGEAVITSEPPEVMIAATDPLRPWMARAALKVWRDLDHEKDFAYVWANGERQKFERPMYDPVYTGRRKRLNTGAFGSWEPVADGVEQFDGDVPVFVFENYESLGEFETHTDLLDRINGMLLDRLVTVAMQAFRQRALKGPLPATDSEGNQVDYAALFAPGPGALWNLPDGVDIWESQESAQSIQQMLAAVKDDVKDLAAVTRTPVAVLVPDSANQSAEGAAFAREGLVFKAKDRISRMKPSVDALLARALQVENADFDGRVKTLWAPPEHVSLAEKYDAAVKAQAAGVPWRTVMLDILGFTADDVDRMQAERASDQLTVQALLTERSDAQVAERAVA